MISKYQLQKRINDVQHEIVPPDRYFENLHRARLDILNWIKKEEGIRSEEELSIKIDRYKEELLAYSDYNSLQFKEIMVRIEELQNAINNND